ncbi:MAG: CheC family chemotaxis protein [uncultured bacterium]|nr:MAG: CheC family chemotaxis protein [uncultured bacterium]
MTELKSIFTDEFVNLLTKISKEGIENASKGFSGMLGKELHVKSSTATLVKLIDISKMLGGPEDETVAIYLKTEGGIAGQMMLAMPFEKAMGLVDMIMGEPVGTTTTLGQMEKSALQELGNITGTYFLNYVSDNTGSSVRPTPPAVMVDMCAAILDIVIATAGLENEEVLMFNADFVQGELSTEIQFWVIPDPKTIMAYGAK